MRRGCRSCQRNFDDSLKATTQHFSTTHLKPDLDVFLGDGKFLGEVGALVCGRGEERIHLVLELQRLQLVGRELGARLPDPRVRPAPRVCNATKSNQLAFGNENLNTLL